MENTCRGSQLCGLEDRVRRHGWLEPGSPVVTPLDGGRLEAAYRDARSRAAVAVKAASYPAANFISAVPEPTRDQVEEFYARYKDALPEPTRETPGFKVPRQIKVEILSIDGALLARTLQEKLTEAELRTYYENRKAEFIRPTGFPDDIFAGDPKAELTPPQSQPFEESLRPTWPRRSARIGPRPRSRTASPRSRTTY